MDNIKEFCVIMEGIMLDLRFLRGLDEEKVIKFRDVLEKIIDEWKDKDYVPKLLCNLFIDFYPSVEASSYLYNNEEEKEKILSFADKMQDLMRICVDVNDKDL